MIKDVLRLNGEALTGSLMHDYNLRNVPEVIQTLTAPLVRRPIIDRLVVPVTRECQCLQHPCCLALESDSPVTLILPHIRARVETCEGELFCDIQGHIRRLIARYLQCSIIFPLKGIRFEWDPRKAGWESAQARSLVLRKLGRVFLDDEALLVADPEHSESEDRFILLGRSAEWRLLVAVHALHERRGCHSVISARKADRQEQLTYMRRRRLT